MAAKTMRAAAMSVSGSVTESRDRMRPATGTSYWMERPRLPRRAPPIHSTYWTGSGRSRPIDARRRATVSGEASMPSMRMAGSPGRTLTTTKTSAETKRRVAAIAATLLRMRRRTGILLLPGDLAQVHRGDGQILPDPRHTLLGDDQARMHVEPDHGRLVGHHPLEPRELLAALLVVDGLLRLFVQRLELLVVPAEVVARVRVVHDVPGLGVADDGEVVVGLLPHLGEPPPPLDLLDLHLDADLGELAHQHLARAHRVVVLRRDAQDGVEAVRVSRLGEELLGLGGIIGHGLGHVHEVGIERIHVGAEDAPEAEHRALEHLLLVDGVGHGEPHPLVRVRLPRVVHSEDDVVRGVAEDHLETRVLPEIDHVLRAQAEGG